jgi:hypothetical protein
MGDRDDIAAEFRRSYLYIQPDPEPWEPPRREGVATPAIIKAWLKARGLPYEFVGFEGGTVMLRPIHEVTE